MLSFAGGEFCIFSSKTKVMKTFRCFDDGCSPVSRLLALFFALMLWAFLPPVLAQPKLGVIGGVNFSDYRQKGTDNSGVEYNMRTGFKAGLVGEMMLGNSGFAIQAEPMYVQKGAVEKISLLGARVEATEYDIKMDYIELPILVKYSFHFGALHPFLVAGPEFGLLLKAESEGYDIKDEYENFDFLLTAGAGLDVEMADMVFLFVESRYNHGLSNICAVKDHPADIYNRGVQVMGGVKLALW
jgi:opacity protein-like surface antigen